LPERFSVSSPSPKRVLPVIVPDEALRVSLPEPSRILPVIAV